MMVAHIHIIILNQALRYAYGSSFGDVFYICLVQLTPAPFKTATNYGYYCAAERFDRPKE